MEMGTDLKQQVREFYDSVGWQEISEGVYQNARYEDLRPVSREYIHNCHLRVGRHIPSSGRYLLDAGSGPIQYPEYLEYSKGYQYRVCLDISITALTEARKRIGEHGLFVVGDLAHLPFRDGAFEGLVSLHAVHHLPADEHRQAYFELQQVLSPNGRGVVVTSQGKSSALMRLTRWPTEILFRIIRLYRGFFGSRIEPAERADDMSWEAKQLLRTPGTHTAQHDYSWLSNELFDLPGLDIRVWRSVNTSFLRAFIHRPFGGQALLRLLFGVEERAPHSMARIGQYPMILFSGGDIRAPAKEEM